MNLEHLTYWQAQISYMGHCRVLCFHLRGHVGNYNLGLTYNGCQCPTSKKKSYSYYKPLAHEIYVKFVLSLYCFHSVNKLGGRARKSGILVCFLLLGTTPKPKSPWRGKVYSVLQVSQEPRDRNWRTGPGGHFLLARLQAHIQLPFGTIQSIFWGWSCPQCADPPTSVSKKKMPTGQHASGGSSVEALFSGVSRWQPK